MSERMVLSTMRQKLKKTAIMSLMSLILASPTMVVLANETKNTELPTETQNEAYDDVYRGDDTYYADDSAKAQEDKNDTEETGVPYDERAVAGAEYRNWDDAVIIEKAETKILVKENNTYDVVKTITVYYNTEDKHELNMVIPKNNFTTQTSDLVENLSVETSLSKTKYKMSSKANEYDIKIEDGTKGETYGNYTISYTYVSRGDNASDYDVFVQDILGFTNAPVRSASFSVVMPKKYKQQNLYFQDKEKNNLNLLATTKGTEITGYYDTKLDKGSLTMTLLVPNGYFKSTSVPIWWQLLLFGVLVVSIMCVINGFGLAAISYYKFGRSKKPKVIPQNRPIKGLSPVDIIAAMNGGVTNENLLLYILQLANEGYLRIEDTTYKHSKHRNVLKGYYFVKVKDYDGSDKYAKQFMKILFEKGDKVTPAELSGKVYDKLDNLRLRIQDEGIKDLWDIDTDRRKLCQNIGLLIPLLTSLLMSLYNIDAGLSLYTFSFVYGPVMSILIYIIIKKIDARLKKRNVMHGGVADTMTWIYVFGSSLIILMIIGTLNGTMFIKHGALMTMSYFSEIVLMYCSCNMKKRTEEGIILCGKILGFRQWIIDADELIIKKAVLRDEQYIYKMVPFAVALGLASDGWLATMDGCYIDDPTWYRSNSDAEFRLTEFKEDYEVIAEAILEEPDENDEDDDE